jgi:hypothetical protein
MEIMKRLTLDFNHGESLVNVCIQKMEGTVHISLFAPSAGPHLENLICAMKTPYSEMPAATALIGSESVQSDGWATSLGQKLARRLNIQLLVSCSLPPQYEGLFPYVERELLKILIADLGRPPVAEKE